MNKIITFFFILFILAVTNIQAQDTINLLNGKQIIAKSIYEEPSSTLLKYDIGFRNKSKQKAVDLLNVYSINYFNKTNKIFYKQDSAIGYDLSIPQMNYYIMGEREAIKNCKTQWIAVGGFILGVTATHVMQFWGVITPAVYAAAIGISNPKMHYSENINYSTSSDFNFNEGYKFKATHKKVKNALLGSIIGITAYAITSYTINVLY